MRFDPIRCPECGELANAVMEEIRYCRALISEPGPDGEVEYSGGTDVNWDGQAPMREDGGRILLTCPDGHDWLAVASGEDISYGVTDPFAPRTSRVRSDPVTPTAPGG
jgi:hypothetical protein